MQRQQITKIIGDMVLECLQVMKSNEGYESYREYDDATYLPETDRGRFHCLLDVHERLTGLELLPGYKTKKIDSLRDIDISDIDVSGLIKLLKKGKRDEI